MISKRQNHGRIYVITRKWKHSICILYRFIIQFVHILLDISQFFFLLVSIQMIDHFNEIKLFGFDVENNVQTTS